MVPHIGTHEETHNISWPTISHAKFLLLTNHLWIWRCNTSILILRSRCYKVSLLTGPLGYLGNNNIWKYRMLKDNACVQLQISLTLPRLGGSVGWNVMQRTRNVTRNVAGPVAARARACSPVGAHTSQGHRSRFLSPLPAPSL